jgi:hypothetical protein
MGIPSAVTTPSTLSGNPSGQLRENNMFSNEDLEGGNFDEPINEMLQDGDEFVFKLVSFDKWINISIHFVLDGDPNFVLNSKTEMRVAGYFQNSHFFQLITKLIINIWNENIEDLLERKDFYVVKDISFMYKQRTDELLNHAQEKETNIIEVESSKNPIFSDVLKDIKMEITNINLTKQKYILVPIDPSAKVDDVFDYSHTILVNAVFCSVAKALRDQKKESNAPIQNLASLVNPGKYRYGNSL